MFKFTKTAGGYDVKDGTTGQLLGTVKKTSTGKWRHSLDRHPWATFDTRESAAIALRNSAL